MAETASQNGTGGTGSPLPPGRSLALAGTVPGRAASPDPRPAADFVTHLIACEQRLAAFRARRRENAPAGSASYGPRAARRGPALDLSV